jgi:curli biogenesis system outer membrane secretion channel CsgG
MKLKVTFKLLFFALIYIVCVGGKINYVPTEAQGSGVTRNDAISDALQNAVSKINGAEIAAEMSNSIRENFSEVDGKEKFSSKQDFQEDVKRTTKGVIRSWRVLTENNETGNQGLWTVRLSVSVAQYELSKQLKRLRLTIAPFQVGQSVSDSQVAARFMESFPNGLIDYLTQTRRFALLDRDFLESQSRELEFVRRGDVRAEELAKLGNKVGADYVIAGLVEDVFSRENTVTMRSTGQQIRNVETGARVSYRIIDVATTQIKFSDTVTYDPSMGKITVRELADYISDIAGQTIVNAIYPVAVVANFGNQVTLGQGGKTIRMGEQFQLVRHGKDIFDPHTKESLGKEEIVVGLIKITNVQAKTSTAEIVEGGEDISNSFASNTYVARPLPKKPPIDPGIKVREAAKSSREKINERLEDDY